MASSNSVLATNARFKMNAFVKKFLGVLVVGQLTFLAWPAQKTMNLGGLPLWFEATRGQADSQYVAHGRDSEFMVSPAGTEMVLREAGGKTASTRMEFVGANPAAEISGDAAMGGKISYLIGNDSTRWQSGLAAFGRVRVERVYPGINVVYYGNQQRLEYDFDLAPGARPEMIALRFTGADKVSVNSEGDLDVKLDGRDIIQHQPVAYQVSGGIRQAVQVSYRTMDARTVGFSVGHYDSGLPLVIDPVLAYSTFFGGNKDDIVWAVAFGTNDNSVYIAGQTVSTTIADGVGLATPGAFQTTLQGGQVDGDAFVAKFGATGTNLIGTNLIYCTYLGGSGEDVANALTVDGEGHAFVAGTTDSLNFPHTNAIMGTYGNPPYHYNGSQLTGSFDNFLKANPFCGFVTELDASGANLVYSTYLGGGGVGWNSAFGVAVDGEDRALVVGETFSTNFPVTANAYQTKFASVNNFYLGCNAFVSEIASNGNTLNYSTYLGGTNQDTAYSVSVNNGFVAVVGTTCSSNFPTTNYLGVTANSVGFTSSGQFLNGLTSGNLNNNLQILPYVFDGFVTLFQETNGTNLAPVYSTFLGGTNNDVAYGVAVDASGTAFVVGGTTSINFPNTTNMLSSFVLTNGTGVFLTNAFLTQIKLTNGSPVIGFSQVFGGAGNDIGWGVTLDAAENVFIAGSTSSVTNFNANPEDLLGSLSWTNAGGYDAFVTVFKSDLSGLIYSADFGSSFDDSAYCIAVDPEDSVYVAGATYVGPSAVTAYPLFNSFQPMPPDDVNGFLAKIWMGSSISPQLLTSTSGTNLLLSWAPEPQAQIGSGTFFVQTATNLLSMVVTTNLIPPIPPATLTNEVVVTNWVAAPNWTTLAVPPVRTTNGVTTFTVTPTSQNQFFRLKSF